MLPPQPQPQQPQTLAGHPGQHTLQSVNAPNLGAEFMSQVPEPETVFLYIPNVAVGAIIGTKGSFIKNIIKLSGASVKITPLTPEESKTAAERQVVIVGSSDSQWKAQYYIYEKIRQERFATDENVKLRAELQVPSHIVGRIIGKAGKNVRELQRTTGATIKLPEDIALNQQQQQETGSSQQPQQDDENDDENNSSVNNVNQLSPSATASASAPETTTTPTTTTTTITPLATTAAAVSPQTTENNTVNVNGTATSDSANNTATEQENVKSEPSPSSPTTGSSQAATPVASNPTTNSSVVVVRIFGTFQASQLAQRRIQSLVMQSLRGYSTNDAILLNQRTLTNITNHHGFQMPFMNSYQPHPQPQPQPPHFHPHHHHQQQQHHHHQQQHQRNDYQMQSHQPRMNGGNGVYNQNQNRRNNRHQQVQNNPTASKLSNNSESQQSKPETNGNGPSMATSQPQAVVATNGLPNEQTQQPQQQTA